MFSSTIFFGFPITSDYSKALEAVDPQIIKLFVSSSDEGYLQETIREEVRYLGKFLGESVQLSALHLLEEHIYSILNKMTPDYPCKKTPLVVFAVESNPLNE